MKFKNNNHQALFNNEAKRMNRHDNVKMATLYLLTANFKLWNEAKRHIKRGNIDLDSIKVRNGNLKAYTLLSVARDIACGTSYLFIHDLANTDIISDKQLSPEKLEIRRTKDYFDCIAPSTIRFFE